MNPTLRLLAALGLAAVATTASAEGDAAAGRIKFETCRGCHSVPSYTNAFPVYHVPKVGGQHAARVVAALTAYRSGERKHPTMVAQAASLTDQDMQDIAAYLAGEKAAHAPRRPAGAKPEPKEKADAAGKTVTAAVAEAVPASSPGASRGLKGGEGL